MALAVNTVVREALSVAVESGRLVPRDRAFPVFTALGFEFLEDLSKGERGKMSSQVGATIRRGDAEATAYLLHAWRFSSTVLGRDGHHIGQMPFDPQVWGLPDGLAY